MVQAKEGDFGLNQIGYGHDVNKYVCLHACTSIYAIILQCLLMLVDDDDVNTYDVNTCDDQGNYADRRGGHLSRDGEEMWVCLHVCIHIETYRASWYGHTYAYVSRGKGEQRTDRACLEIRLYREIGKRTCLQTHVCMCEYK